MDAAQQAAALRRRKDKWTEHDVLQVAQCRLLSVHKYHWHQTNLRKLTRRMCADGKLAMVDSDRDYFHYRTAK